MKQCPNCSTKNPDSAKFCQNCGTNLEEVEATQTDLSDAAGKFFSQAGSLLNDGLKKAKESVATGLEQSKKSTTDEGKNVQSTVSAGGWESPILTSNISQPNSGWDDAKNPNEAASVTVKKYSFFQSEDEETIAVIGEKAAVSDLEGTYRGPYAVLTKERLYCKNEDGNFRIPVSEILSAKQTTTRNFEWALLISITLSILAATMLLLDFLADISGGYGIIPIDFLLPFSAIFTAVIAIYFHRRKDLKKTSIALVLTILLTGIYAFFLNVIFALIYLYHAWKSRSIPDIFYIHCIGREFPFVMENYPLQEVQDFQTQLSLLTGISLTSSTKIKPKTEGGNVRGNSYQTYQPPRQSTGRSPIVTIAAVMVILAIIIFAGVSIFRTLTICKVDGCGNEVYKDGYCTVHYAGNRVGQATGDLFDSFFR